jgi:hypothetical protein
MPEWRVVSMPGSDKLPLTGTQGWRQFSGAKKKMLDAYDLAKGQARAHEVEVFHGRVAEGQVREWLGGFLPKRYGVTSGYIVSQGQTESTKLPHFDVIIYDQIEAPVLWIEDSPDTTTVGTSRAIPAEYVRAVLEVKAAFNAYGVATALEHLADLGYLLAGVDAPGEQFKKFLPQRFFTAIIFFELRSENRNAWSELFKFVPDRRKVWPGGLILRGEGLRPELSATIGLSHNTNSPPVPIGPTGRDLIDSMVQSESRKFDGTYWSALLKWTSNEFSTFAFDLLAMLNGTYQPGRVSSNHAQSWIDFSKQTPPK